ncbi:MAG: nucleotidyltransferase family protein [Bacteroidaceae bacterium]|nr:nucleotidyltransferase family protein [Bacteroidaceae bacterium]
MSTKTLKHIIADYFETQPVLKAWLFGSYARGEETENSDVDILVQFDHSTQIGLFAYARMHRELEECLGCKVDLVEEGTLRPSAQRSANRDKKIVYE